MTENKQFKLHIKLYNKEKTEGEFILKDGGQPLGVIESIEDARLIRDTLNELYDEKEQLKSEIEKLSYANEDLLEEKRIWKQMSDEYTKLSDENEQLKQFIMELTTKNTDRIDLANGHSYNVKYMLKGD